MSLFVSFRFISFNGGSEAENPPVLEATLSSECPHNYKQRNRSTRKRPTSVPMQLMAGKIHYVLSEQGNVMLHHLYLPYITAISYTID